MSAKPGVRKNVLQVSDDERNDLRDAIIALNVDPKFRFSGNRDDTPFVGGVTYWFKQDEIHQATHVHRGPAFLTWHRELCNRFERLLRLVNPNVSLHYWNWNEDPKALFTNKFMGNSQGEAGDPWATAMFYNPNVASENYRGIDPFDLEHSNPADPPLILTRERQDGSLIEFLIKYNEEHQDKIPIYSDKEIVESDTFPEMRSKLETMHNYAHGYIGGTIGDPHISFRDPFVFLIHSNVDRIFSAWQLRKGFEWRLKPEEVYGEEKNTQALGSTHPYIIVGINTMLSPWCGVGYPYEKEVLKAEQGEEPGVNDVRPWTYPENWHRDPDRYPDERPKNSLDKSIVTPTLYDSFPDGFEYNYAKAGRL